MEIGWKVCECNLLCSLRCLYLVLKFVIDRYWFFISDTDYLYVYVTDIYLLL